jgi:molybdopterin-guanine dinucleotide biosynthesis protein A
MASMAKLSGISAVVLAGGKSRRMGRDKRFLDIGGVTLLQQVLGVLEPIFSEILLIVAQPVPALEALGHPLVADLIPGCASLGGVYTGLASAGHPRVFVAACDMPMLNAKLIQQLSTINPEADIVIARLATGLQPTHAVYSKVCLPHLERMAKADNLRLQEIAGHPDLRVQVLSEREVRDTDPDLLSFFNVNTPADLEFARKLLAGRQAGSAKQP